MYGYDLSSRSAMLYFGWYSLMRFASRISACASLGTTIVSSPPTDCIKRARLDALEMIVREVTANARAKSFRLADVQHGPIPVPPQIDARPIQEDEESCLGRSREQPC